MQTNDELARQISSGIRAQQELGGLISAAEEISARMMANRLSLGADCARCGSQEVYCCATTHGEGSEIACICVHICFGCGENLPAADLVWRGASREPIRCFHCDRIVPLFIG